MADNICPSNIIQQSRSRKSKSKSNFYNPQNLAEQVDIIINYDLTGKKVQNIKTTDGTIRMLRLADLIAMKRGSGRPQDLEDVKALEKIR